MEIGAVFCYYDFSKYAGVAELEYAHALGACLARVVSSSLTAGT